MTCTGPFSRLREKVAEGRMRAGARAPVPAAASHADASARLFAARILPAKGFAMSTLAPPADPESDPRVKAVFDDIRATRKSDVVNNFWLYLAFDPALLEDTWRGVKEVMAKPSALDPLTKELIYIAVSLTNSCRYCVHSHTAAARAKGMTDAIYADLLRVVSTAGRTNQLLNALQVPVDAAFDAEATAERS